MSFWAKSGMEWSGVDTASAISDYWSKLVWVMALNHDFLVGVCWGVRNFFFNCKTHLRWRGKSSFHLFAMVSHGVFRCKCLSLSLGLKVEILGIFKISVLFTVTLSENTVVNRQQKIIIWFLQQLKRQECLVWYVMYDSDSKWPWSLRNKIVKSAQR